MASEVAPLEGFVGNAQVSVVSVLTSETKWILDSHHLLYKIEPDGRVHLLIVPRNQALRSVVTGCHGSLNEDTKSADSNKDAPVVEPVCIYPKRSVDMKTRPSALARKTLNDSRLAGTVRDSEHGKAVRVMKTNCKESLLRRETKPAASKHSSTKYAAMLLSTDALHRNRRIRRQWGDIDLNPNQICVAAGVGGVSMQENRAKPGVSGRNGVGINRYDSVAGNAVGRSTRGSAVANHSRNDSSEVSARGSNTRVTDKVAKQRRNSAGSNVSTDCHNAVVTGRVAKKRRNTGPKAPVSGRNAAATDVVANQSRDNTGSKVPANRTRNNTGPKVPARSRNAAVTDGVASQSRDDTGSRNAAVAGVVANRSRNNTAPKVPARGRNVEVTDGVASQSRDGTGSNVAVASQSRNNTGPKVPARGRNIEVTDGVGSRSRKNIGPKVPASSRNTAVTDEVAGGATNRSHNNKGPEVPARVRKAGVIDRVAKQRRNSTGSKVSADVATGGVVEKRCNNTGSKASGRNAAVTNGVANQSQDNTGSKVPANQSRNNTGSKVSARGRKKVATDSADAKSRNDTGPGFSTLSDNTAVAVGVTNQVPDVAAASSVAVRDLNGPVPGDSLVKRKRQQSASVRRIRCSVPCCRRIAIANREDGKPCCRDHEGDAGKQRAVSRKRPQQSAELA